MNSLSESLRNVARFVKYRNARKKYFREIKVKREQDRQLREFYKSDTSSLIVFFVPGADWETGRDKITGGAISIVSLCEETVLLNDVHQAATIMCTINGDHLFLKHTFFDNNTSVYRFEQLPLFFTNLKKILVHIPEYLVPVFSKTLKDEDVFWLKGIDQIHLNIMNQNIKLMPAVWQIDQLRQLTANISMTTAHQKYCTSYYREKFGVPIHKFSVWISPEQYNFKNFKNKRNLIIVSPDSHPMKEQILKLISQIPGLDIRIITGISYSDYKNLISEAKWTLTFGEGLDGYLIEPVFSGAVGFAVFNEEFFTSDFSSFRTIYKSHDEMLTKIVSDIAELNSENKFAHYQDSQYKLCAFYYNKDTYRNNIKAFYKREYTFP